MQRRNHRFCLLASLLIAGCATQQTSSGNAAVAEQTASTQAGATEQARQALLEIDQRSCPSDADSFGDWVMRFQSYALNQGRSVEAVELAFRDVSENTDIADKASKQPEFVTPIWTYLDRAVSPERIALGKEMYAIHGATVRSVAKKYGVSDGILMGIWGIETDFGRNFGNVGVFEALSNLGYRAGRHEFACNELLAAIDIVANDHLEPRAMIGSWAGAMGHPQFLPSSYLSLAVDEDGSGAPDLWSSMADVFASIANHLKRDDWRADVPWGFEVRLPQGFPYAEAELDRKFAIGHWRNRGVTRTDGSALPTIPGNTAILLPAGWRGPAFLITANFEAILRYNYSTSYALSVALLGDRVLGAGGLVGQWPVTEQPLSLDERMEVQSLLSDLGFDPGKIDGILGINTRNAARKFQASMGLPADGFVTKSLLTALREKSAG